MLPISNKSIPGEVQIIFGVMSLRRAGFSSQPPAPCIPGAAICHVPCLCLSRVQTDLGRGNRGGTGVTEKHQVSTMVKIYSPPTPKPLPRGSTAHGRASRPGLGLLPGARDPQAAAGMAPGVVVTNTDGQCHLPRPSPATGTAPAPGCVQNHPEPCGTRPRVGRRRDPGPRSLLWGKAFVLLLPPCGQEFSFLPGLSIVRVAGL